MGREQDFETSASWRWQSTAAAETERRTPTVGGIAVGAATRSSDACAAMSHGDGCGPHAAEASSDASLVPCGPSAVRRRAAAHPSRPRSARAGVPRPPRGGQRLQPTPPSFWCMVLLSELLLRLLPSGLLLLLLLRVDVKRARLAAQVGARARGLEAGGPARPAIFPRDAAHGVGLGCIDDVLARHGATALRPRSQGSPPDGR